MAVCIVECSQVNCCLCYCEVTDEWLFEELDSGCKGRVCGIDGEMLMGILNVVVGSSDGKVGGVEGSRIEDVLEG